MKNKKNFIKYTAAIFFVVILMGLSSCNVINFSGAASSVSKTASTAAAGTVAETTAVSSGLSEQADKAALNEFFTELGLGKLPENGNLPFDLKKGDNKFVSNGKDQLVIYGTLLKDLKLSNAVYDVKSKKYIRGKAEFPTVIKAGGFAGSEPVNLPSGLYEYKIWVGDKLVGVFPFEVKP
jgi:hypothetical protein